MCWLLYLPDRTENLTSMGKAFFPYPSTQVYKELLGQKCSGKLLNTQMLVQRKVVDNPIKELIYCQ